MTDDCHRNTKYHDPQRESAKGAALSPRAYMWGHRAEFQMKHALTSITLLSMLLLAACSASDGGASGPTSTSAKNLTFWYTEDPTHAKALLALVDTFNSNHTDIHVTPQAVDPFTLHDKFAAAANAGTAAPDIIEMNSLWTTEFASKKYILSLDGKVGNTSDVLPVALSYSSYNSQLYSLPQTIDFLAMYYNKALLQNANISTPPTTMTEMRTDAQALTTGTGQYGFATAGTSAFILPFLYAEGGELLSTDGHTVEVNSNSAVRGFSDLLTLISDGSVASIDPQNGYDTMDNNFKSGKAAIIFNGAGQVKDLLSGSAFSGGHAADFGVAAIPMGASGDLPRSPASGQSLAIYSGTPHHDEAATFLTYIDSSASQLALTKANGTLPTRSAPLASTDVTNNPALGYFASLTASAKARPVTAVDQRLFTAFDTDINKALLGRQTAKAALDQVAKDWKTILGTP